MSMLKEFKDFAVQGNVIDMAVGIVVGGAFSPIAKSLVDDVIMPPLGMLLGHVNFKDMFVLLQPGTDGGVSYPTLQAAHDAGAITLNYGQFANTVLTFLILASVMFLLVRGINKLRREHVPPPTAEETAQAEA
jgi:large conductance mechanosensitive channel